MSNRKYKEDENILTSIKSWTVGKSKEKATPFVRVTFNDWIDWTGWLTPKTTERTMGTLAMLGFKGEHLGMLNSADALDVTKEFSAVIGEAREYNGNWYHSAKWINAVGGFTGKLDAQTMDEFSRMDTRAYISGTVKEKAPDTKAHDIGTDAAFTTDQIPF